MAKLIRCLAPGASREWSEKSETVPGDSPFHRAKAMKRKEPSKLRRTVKVVLAFEVRKALKGKRGATARHRRNIVKMLAGE